MLDYCIGVATEFGETLLTYDQSTNRDCPTRLIIELKGARTVDFVRKHSLSVFKYSYVKWKGMTTESSTQTQPT